MSNEILIENARLREALAKVGGFANSWIKHVDLLEPNHLSPSQQSIVDKLTAIEHTCKAALEQK